MSVRLAPSPWPACEWMHDPLCQFAYVRWIAGRTLLDEILPVVARGNSWSLLPLERIGDAFLSIVNDWLSFRPHTSTALLVRLEKLNRQILEEHRQKIEGPAPREEKPAPRPTRKGKPKPKPKRGRR